MIGDDMNIDVKIKRLENCFKPSLRYIKRQTVLEYLDMFDSSSFHEELRKLRQFDEQPTCSFHEIYHQVMENTISDSDLDTFMNAVNIVPEENLIEDFKEIGLPVRATSGAAGVDLQAAIDDVIYIKPGQTVLVPTGLSMSMPEQLELQVRPRSGLAAKNSITVLNSPGTVDSDYGGQICVILINHGNNTFTINRGDRIAQAVFNQIAIPTLIEVDSLEKTERGAKGFGSTGI